MTDKLNFVLDVDGVMTTGQFIYSRDGKLYKIFGPHDNDGLKMLKDKLNIFFITADKRGYPITEKRIVDDMGQKLTFVTEKDRLGYFKKNFKMNRLIYMGDGYHDAPILKDCLFGIAPNNARKEAKEAADYVTPSNAGEGAVLDACLYLLKLLRRGLKLN